MPTEKRPHRLRMAAAAIEPGRELPHVLTIADLAAVLRRSINFIEKQLARGTFPIPMINGLEGTGVRRPRLWRRADVLDFLGEGHRASGVVARRRA